jgi:hypothetical protein
MNPLLLSLLYGLLVAGLVPLLRRTPSKRSSSQSGRSHRPHVRPGQGHRPGAQRRRAIHQRARRRQRQEARADQRRVRFPAAARGAAYKKFVEDDKVLLVLGYGTRTRRRCVRTSRRTRCPTSPDRIPAT